MKPHFQVQRSVHETLFIACWLWQALQVVYPTPNLFSYQEPQLHLKWQHEQVKTTFLGIYWSQLGPWTMSISHCVGFKKHWSMPYCPSCFLSWLGSECDCRGCSGHPVGAKYKARCQGWQSTEIEGAGTVRIQRVLHKDHKSGFTHHME